ncbi:hypothetical protein SBRCBS47491_001673 [Sporothrix bragantina]|uniref:C6 zinc finger domain containing protein n=1 Tax=Sporothrix bragantina TaxID=671064 RepID=A0ABP0B0I5_9PEZI
MASTLQTGAATGPSSMSNVTGSSAYNANSAMSASSTAQWPRTTGLSAESRPMNQQHQQPQSQQQEHQKQEQQQSQQQQQGPTVLTFALKHRPRATRASVPKASEKRHVKCDEVKPACNRFIKWQGFCEGYENVPESAPAAASTTEAATGAPAKTTTQKAKPTATIPVIATATGIPPGGSVSNSPRHQTKPANKNTRTVPTIVRASSTSSSSATQGSRRTTPSSDVSASEYPILTCAASRTSSVADKSAAPSLVEEDEDDDVEEIAYVPAPAFQPAFQATFQETLQPVLHMRRQTVYKRDHQDEDDDEYDTTDYYTYDVYNDMQNQTTTQHFFDLSLIHEGSPLSSASSSSTTAFPLEPNYNSVMFASQWEKAYFDSWLTLAPNLGGGWFPSHLWTSTIPQLCRDEPAVRFAAIAIGAMAQAMSPALLGKSYYHMLNNGSAEGDNSASSSTTDKSATNSASSPDAGAASASRVVPHYRNALTYYGHALRLLRLGGGGLSGNENMQGPPGRQTSLPGQQPYTGVDLATPPSSEKERAAVLCCLLFVCFEALQGNREGALQHITHGLQIVDQFVARNLPAGVQDEQRHGHASWVPQPPTSKPQAQSQENGDAEWQRRRQRQRQRDRQLGLLSPDGIPGEFDVNATGETGNGGHRSTGSEDRPSDALTRVLTRSPAPYVLEDEVMQVFRRLDFQAWSLGVFRLRRTRPADIKFQALDALNPATIPACFDSLDDARRWWDFVQHWILQFPRYMVAALQRYMDENPDAAARATAAGRMLDICDVPGAREIQREYLNCLERWNAAFHPLYDATRRHKLDGTSSSSAEAAFLKAASLKIQYLLAWIGVSSLVYSDYEAMYQLTPQFRELNRLAALILPKQPRYTWSPFGGGATMLGGGPAGGSVGSGGVRGDLFTMDNGPTMALFVVSCKCRVEAVRDESIRLLAAYPRRDGFWDSKILWAIADWNRVIEAENETEGSLYEQWLRLRQREAIFDETKPEVQMTAWVKNKVTGKFEKLTQTVKWDR